MSGESPDVVLYDSSGNMLAVQNATAIPASTPALMIAGSDGTNSRYITIDTSGRVITAGAGVAGTPAGGVLTIQGVSGGTVIPANVSQFGGNNVITGTGVSGVGIPRVTVSSDSNILATQSGTWTVAQGAPNTITNKWPVQVTDGTHTMPTMDAIARAGFHEITDGTNGPVAVKASTTAPVLADQALVVVISPNQQAIPVTSSSANATTGVSFGRVTYGNTSNTLTAVRATAYTEQTTNFTGSVKSASANDTSAGTGARTITITYYDQTGAGPFTETVTLNGTTAVNLVNVNHCFIEKMAVVTVGSGATNAGTISLFTGAAGAGTLVGTIGVATLATGRGDNTTLWAHHYTPTGKTSSIFLINAGTTGNQNADFSVYTIPVLVANAAEIKISDSLVSGANSDSVSRLSSNPIKITGFARSTLYVVSAGANQPYSGGFDYSDQ